MADREVTVFSFAFERPLDRWARWFAVVPTRSFVRVDDVGFEAVYGWWRVATTWSNVVGVERTGPYRAWKVAGPARMSWRDRGITMSPTTEAGVCLRLRHPVPGIAPLGLIRHPGVTLGLSDLDDFTERANQRIGASAPAGDESSPPSHAKGGLLATLRALRNWSRRSVTHEERTVDEVRPPPLDRAGDADDQPPEVGCGPMFHRRYRIVVADVAMAAEQAMAMIQAEPNLLADTTFAPFTKSRGRTGEMAVGDRYVIQIAGPWKGAVEVIDTSALSFRLATLEGHMESGLIDMRVADVADRPGALMLTIESWARSHDRVLDVLYDKLGLAKALQSEMWAIACERFAALVGGAPEGPLSILTERAAATGVSER